MRFPRSLGGEPGDGASDAGSAVAEFVMVSALLLFVALGVLQLSVVLYARNIAASAAHEGAHVASLSDSGPAQGEARALALLDTSFTTRGASVEASRGTVNGVMSVSVTVTVPVAVVGVFDVGAVSVTATAFEEAAYGR